MFILFAGPLNQWLTCESYPYVSMRTLLWSCGSISAGQKTDFVVSTLSQFGAFLLNKPNAFEGFGSVLGSIVVTVPLKRQVFHGCPWRPWTKTTSAITVPL